MSDTARVVTIHTHGGSDALTYETAAVPAPQAGEVTIVHKACGLNFIDIYQREGLYKLPLPHVMGVEGAGEVVAIGEGVTHLKVGDRAAYATQPPGSFATLRTLKAAQVCPLPDAVSYEEAAAAMLKGLTVNYLFHRTVPLKAGDTVLFHAAAGGVGLIACQWAKSEGIRLIATAGSDEKCALALEHGASDAINYRTEDWVARVGELTGGRGVDVVMDSVGADTFEGSLACLRKVGMMISFGNASGPVPPVNLLSLSAKSLQITRPTLFTHTGDFDTCQQMARELFAKIASGAVKIRIDQRYGFDQIALAQDNLAARKTTGSSVILL